MFFELVIVIMLVAMIPIATTLVAYIDSCFIPPFFRLFHRSTACFTFDW